MTDKAKDAAREYAETIDECCGTSDILISAERAFLAGIEWCRENELKIAVEALESISKNSCCEPCQQAKLVAQSALDKIASKA